MLATHSAQRPGFPFGSVVAYAADAAGRPVLWLSDLAEHTRNPAADPRASLPADGRSDRGPDERAGRSLATGPASVATGHRVAVARRW